MQRSARQLMRIAYLESDRGDLGCSPSPLGAVSRYKLIIVRGIPARATDGQQDWDLRFVDDSQTSVFARIVISPNRGQPAVVDRLRLRVARQPVPPLRLHSTERLFRVRPNVAVTFGLRHLRRRFRYAFRSGAFVLEKSL